MFPDALSLILSGSLFQGELYHVCKQSPHPYRVYAVLCSPRCGSHRARCGIPVEMHAPITEEGPVTRVEQVSNLMISSIGVLGVGKLPSLHGLEQ
jgi:hypothetical protein